MNKQIGILLILCSVILVPSVTLAQEFSIFAKQKVVVAEIRDKNDRPLSDGIKHVVRQSIIDACANSDDYEVYEVNMDDIRQQLKANGQVPSFPNICKQIDKQADFIIFTEIKASGSALGSQEVVIFINATLYRIATATEVLADTEPSDANSRSITEATARLIYRMLGVGADGVQTQQSSSEHSHSFMKTQETTYKVGDLYNVNGKKGIVYSVSSDGKRGKILSLCETHCNWNKANKWCSNLGDGWHLPTREDWGIIHMLKDNTEFHQAQLYFSDTPLHWNGRGDWYWTRDLASSEAWYIYLPSGDTYTHRKGHKFYVRAVSAF